MATKLDCPQCPVWTDICQYIKDDLDLFFTDYVKRIFSETCEYCQPGKKQKYDRYARDPEKFYKEVLEQAENLRKSKSEIKL